MKERDYLDVNNNENMAVGQVQETHIRGSLSPKDSELDEEDLKSALAELERV
jgi:hypothetical protein